MTKEQEDLLLKEGKMLPVMEHFYTIQGEELHPLMDATEIAEIAASYCKTIVLTGGEPLMWNLDILTGKLKELGCTIHIETSGAYEMSGILDWITLSPKKTGLPKEEIYKVANELKVIVFNNSDLKFAEEQAAKVNPNCELFLQSEWSKKDANYPKITDFILEHPEWRSSIQTHKYLNIP